MLQAMYGYFECKNLLGLSYIMYLDVSYMPTHHPHIDLSIHYRVKIMKLQIMHCFLL
jgi:hypothetical protein